MAEHTCNVDDPMGHSLSRSLMRGMCSKHYQRWLKHGDPLAIGKAPNGAVSAWIDEMLASPPTDDCVECPLGQDAYGYPQLMAHGRNRKASHAVLERVGRPRPSSEHEVLHSCDNPPCLNPRHISWDTHRRNIDEMFDRDRARPYGQRIKLSGADVLDIRRRYRRGVNQSDRGNSVDLAAEFGVDRATITAIARRRNRPHV